LRPQSTSKGARVLLYNCKNYTSRYWHVVGGERHSPLRGEWNADWQYQLKNNWTGYCLKVNAITTTGNQTLIQTDCSIAGKINFMPSPNSFAGEYVVIRGTQGGGLKASKQYCLRAVSGRPIVNGGSSTTHQCAYWGSMLWHRAAW
jgi:hypothetical protein